MNPIFATYLENEDAAKRLISPMGVDDYRLCVEMAAEEHGVTYEEAREIVSDNISMLGAG
ncbi:MAG: hypothetical protein ACPG4X_22480 [Pikeienuella sp.]